MDNVILYSGWICTLIATAIAVAQFFQKEKYKKIIKNNNFKAKTGKKSQVYMGDKINVKNER
tara:strand:- start:4481 stop:4666 length:186 start_codon:yes stop_codon:yes gene_type:complete